MDIKEAIEILKRENYIVEQVGDKYRVKRPCQTNEPRLIRFTSSKITLDINNILISTRELIKRARYYTSDSSRKTKFKSNVKFFDHRKNRRKTKQCLKHELYDKIPTKKAVHKENRWNWD